MKPILLALALQLSLGPLLSQAPDLQGLATYYGPPAFMQGDGMANGEPLELDAPTVAVDVSHRHLLNRSAFVLTACGLHRVRITDTGKLYQVGGWFRLGVRQGQLRYWPVLDGKAGTPVVTDTVAERGIQWREVKAYQVVADFPRDFFAHEVACEVDRWGRGETTKVWVWVLP